MEFITLPVGEMQANAYILYEPDRNDALVIDPGAEPEAIRLALRGRELSAILLTHGHVDHIGAVGALRSEDAPVYIHEADAAMLVSPNLSLAAMVGGEDSQGDADFCLEEGEITLAGVTLSVLHTPGHTRGSVCFRCEDSLFSGDTLFQAGIGRTDFPGGDDRQMAASLDRLMELPPQTQIYPGHGDATTIGAERRYHG